jgi:hypothetical protein
VRFLIHFLHLAATHARACLIAGLAAGLLLPGMARALYPWLAEMVAVLLLLTALRIGLRAALGALGDLRWGLGAVAILQLALPMALYACLVPFGLHTTPAALAMVLTCAAPAISGSPNLALMMGQDAGRMMQILVLGTAAFPLTVLPILALMPQLGPAQTVVTSALRVFAVILISTGVGFAIRRWLFRAPSVSQIKAMDGASTLAFSIIVVGLMAALNPALRATPGLVALWMLLAFAISYGLQIAVLLTLRKTRLRALAGPLAIGAGTRNIALFLVALPTEVLGPLLVFVGCWQVPMYLTPILLPRLYRKMLTND